MRRFLILLLVLVPSAARGQYDAYTRRAIREQAVAWAGPYSRAFVETGDAAAPALLACSPWGAAQLVSFHASGKFNQLPRRQALLHAIALHGDPVLFFVIQNADELMDLDACNAFLLAPLEYALALKSLDEGAAEVRASKLPYFMKQHWPRNWRPIAVIGGIVVIAGLLWWRRNRMAA